MRSEFDSSAALGTGDYVFDRVDIPQDTVVVAHDGVVDHPDEALAPKDNSKPVP